MGTERNTKQKQVIYSALCALGHPSATELFDYIHAANPTISRGTVFRVLNGFSETGRAKKLRFEESDDRFDATLSPHAHARCRICGKIADVPICGSLPRCGAETGGFSIESCNVEYVGLCAVCNQGKTR